jgi:hypothetical protein
MPSMLVSINLDESDRQAFSSTMGATFSTFYRLADTNRWPVNPYTRIDKETLKVMRLGAVDFNGLSRMVMILFRASETTIPLPDGRTTLPPLGWIEFDPTKHAGASIESVLEAQARFANPPLAARIIHDSTLADMEAAALRLVMTSLCYLNCADAQATELLDRERPKLGDVPPVAILLGRDEKTPAGCHLRSGHFRILQHERFKRADDGKSRVVWVRPAIVNVECQPAEPPEKISQLKPA